MPFRPDAARTSRRSKAIGRSSGWKGVMLDAVELAAGGFLADAPRMQIARKSIGMTSEVLDLTIPRPLVTVVIAAPKGMHRDGIELSAVGFPRKPFPPIA